ncbi:MAG: DUF2298 domain-containing protein [Microthrixaceae bacterium]
MPASAAWWLMLGIVVVVGLIGRAWNLDFDQRQHLHPDERYWAITADGLDRAPKPDPHGTVAGPALDWLDGGRSPAGVYRVTDSFLYGPGMLAASRATAAWLGSGVRHGHQPAAAVARAIDQLGVPLVDDDGAPRFDDAFQVDLVGRLVGALIDTATIALVALIGRRLGGPVAGLAAGAFYASCVLAIQHAHFLGSEPPVAFFAAATILTALHVKRSGRLRPALVGGLCVGLASGAALAFKLSAVGVVSVPTLGCVALVALHRRRADVARVVALVAGAYVAFRVLNPGAFDGLGPSFSSAFRADLGRARQVFDADLPPAVQWAGRSPWVQPLVWFARFTVGPGILAAAAAGAFELIGGLRRRPSSGAARWPVAMALGAIVVPFVYVALMAVPSGRYYVGMLPALCAVAGVGVSALWRVASSRVGWVAVAGRSLALGLVALAALWGLAFVNGVYGQPNTRLAATEWIVENIPRGSVLSSQHWDDALPLATPGVDPSAYPTEQLDLVGTDDEAKVQRLARQLGGIDVVVESSPRLWDSATRIPQRFPSTIAFFEGLDSGALGFRRVATFDASPRLGPIAWSDASAEEAFSVYDHPEVRIWERTRRVPTDAIVSVLDPASAATALDISPADAQANGLMLTDAERAELAEGPTYDQAFHRGSSIPHLFAWFLALELMGLAAFVLFERLFFDLPDAGLGLSKTLGLGASAFALFVLNTHLHVELSRGLIVAVAAGTMVAAAAIGWRRRAALRGMCAERWKMLVLVEAITIAAFAAVVVLRSANPDLWHPDYGGEKPFELAMLTAVLRSRSLPPYDAWFSGGALNYYYGGYLMLAAPARLLRTAPHVVMNLGVATFASCAAGSVFSLAATLSTGMRPPADGSLPGARGRAALAGVLAVGGVMGLSNLAVIPALIDFLGGGSAFGWWSLSRVIPNSTAITEFPAWSLLFADLHSHLMNMCVLAAVGTVALTLYRRLVDGRRGPAVVCSGLLGGLLGLVRATNTWDLPIAVAAAGAALLFAGAGVWRAAGPEGVLRSRDARSWGVAMLVMWAVAAIAWGPYARRGLVFDSGVTAAVARTPMGSSAIQFWLFGLVSLLAIIPAVGVRLRSEPGRFAAGGSVRAQLVGVALAVAGVVALWPEGATLVVTTSLGAALCWVAAGAQTASVPQRVGSAVLGVGWALQAAVEVVTVRNDIGVQNTVFKFWFQSWQVLAIGSAVVLADLLVGHRSAAHRATPPRPWAATAAKGVVVAAVAVSMVFWLGAAPARLGERVGSGAWSLDGERYLATAPSLEVDGVTIHPADDLALIDWLRANVRGVVVVAEAPGEDYRWTGRVSAMTGLPTPIGWQFHERQQRRAYESAVNQRAGDMAELYTSGDEATIARVLDDYEVDYLAFGTVERALSSRRAEAALRDFSCLDVRAAEDGWFVAKVDRSCVSSRRGRA